MHPLAVTVQSCSTRFPLGLRAEIDAVLQDHPEALADCAVVDARVVLAADTERSLESAFRLLRTRIPELQSGAFEVQYLFEPTAQEPYYRVDVSVAHDFWGDVIGDLNRSYGTIEEVRDSESLVVIVANVPVAEMLGYDTALRTMTRGAASVDYRFIGFQPIRPTNPSGPTPGAARRASR